MTYFQLSTVGGFALTSFSPPGTEFQKWDLVPFFLRNKTNMDKISPALEYEQRVNKLKFNMTSLYEGFHSERFECIDLYGWSVPGQDALEIVASLCNGNKLLDYGCGSGLWSADLADRGVDVWPYDPNPHLPTEHIKVQPYIPWVDWDDEYVSMLLSWPLYDDSMGADALNEWILSKAKPMYLFYIGESEGGCTGNDNMFELIKHHFDAYMLVDIPTWPNVHDALYIYRYRN